MKHHTTGDVATAEESFEAGGDASHLTPESAAGDADGRAGEDEHAAPGVRSEVPERFAVRDAATASWAVRKIVETRAFARRVREWADRELRRAAADEEWLIRRFGPEL